MKPQIKPVLKLLLDRYGIDANDEDQLWSAHGVLVLYHSAYERIAAIENISFSPPVVIEAKTTGEEMTVALLVTALLPAGQGRDRSRTEWSIGEASHLNYRTSAKQPGYPYAMAEKRGKDRVIAKLVGLSEFVYSEEEAEDFRKGQDLGKAKEVVHDRPEPGEPLHKTAAPTDPGPIIYRDKPPLPAYERDPQDVDWTMPRDSDEWFSWERAIKAAVDDCVTTGELRVLWHRNEPILEKAKESYSAFHDTIAAVFSGRKQVLLKSQAKGAGNAV